MTIWKGALPVFRISRCRPSLLKVMPTVRHTRNPVSTPRSSPADMSTGSSRAAWGITCSRKQGKSSPRPSSPSPSNADRHLHPLTEQDRKSVVKGKSVSVRDDRGGGRIIKQKVGHKEKRER